MLLALWVRCVYMSLHHGRETLLIFWERYGHVSVVGQKWIHAASEGSGTAVLRISLFHYLLVLCPCPNVHVIVENFVALTAQKH